MRENHLKGDHDMSAATRNGMMTRWRRDEHLAPIGAIKRVLGALGCALALAAAFTTASASAAPSDSLISWFASGRSGEAATLDAEWSFEGSEYFGGALPLTSLTLALPKTSELSAEGFATCSASTLEADGPFACPDGSRAGALGSFSARAFLGAERLGEAGTVEPFFGSGGELLLYLRGVSPVALEVVLHGTYQPATSEYGSALDFSLPLLESVPGAPYVSLEYLNLRLGAFREEAGKRIGSVTFPSCTPLTSTLLWGTDATFYSHSGTVEQSSGGPCPTTSQTTVAASPTAPTVGESVTYTATVMPKPFYTIAPFGLVAFLDNGEPIPSCEAVVLELAEETSTASCKSTFEPGEHKITATFEGDTDYTASTSAPAGVTAGEAAEGETGHKKKVEEPVASRSKAEEEAAAAKVAEERAAAKVAEERAAAKREEEEAARTLPVAGVREVVGPVSGVVLVRAKGAGGFVSLAVAGSLPDGSEVDATDGRALVTVQTPAGLQSAEVYGGRFVIEQEHAGGDETRFVLSLALTGCPRVALPRGSAAAAAGSKHGPKSRHLWVSEHGGSWGTNGRYVSTTVEGTSWLTQDECSRSEVQVATGKVKVDDLVTKKIKILTAGQRYTAKRRA
jgi:hypothetical protein